MADLARLTEVIEPEAQALGFELVRVKMMPSEAGDGGQALQIMAEDPTTGQLVIEQCAALSRRISDRIDTLEEEGEVLIDETLKELETEFGDQFVRIHRNALVALRYIEGMEMATAGHHQVRLRGVDERLTVSRRHVAGLRRVLQSL